MDLIFDLYLILYTIILLGIGWIHSKLIQKNVADTVHGAVCVNSRI